MYSPALRWGIRGGNGGLLRCGKATTWEGGQRVPGIASWPGRIKPGTTTEVIAWLISEVAGCIWLDCIFQLASTLDIFPTLMKLVDVPLPNVTLDGYDMSSILFENGQVRSFMLLMIQALWVSCINIMQSNRDYFIYYPADVTPKLGISAIRWKQYKAHFQSHGYVIYCNNLQWIAGWLSIC